MILAEIHKIKPIKRDKNTEEIFKKIDGYCLASKNLRNHTNYLITQCSRISYKLKSGEILDSWEKGLIYHMNCSIKKYNNSRPNSKPLQYIDENNNFIADAYFLSWLLKDKEVYKEMPLARCGQSCIQMLCRDWKSFYKGMKTYQTNPGTMLGRPHKPKYYKEDGRNWLVLTSQEVKIQEDGYLKFPKVFEGLYVKTKQNELNQVMIITTKNEIRIQVLYETEVLDKKTNDKVMSIDLGVDNLMTLTFNTDDEPLIVNGRTLKSINQYYNKERARLQSISKTVNDRYETNRICKLTQKRNNKVNDYIHKASRLVVNEAIGKDISTIIIGNNKGWKQSVEMGRKNNQTFVSIPYYALIQMITYKAELAGIDVKVVDESYTSGTSYLDGEEPIEENYKKSRRKHRGLFVSNNGTPINADVNGSYQIMKKGGFIPPIKPREKVLRLKISD